MYKICNGCGLYVSQMGLKATSTINPVEVRRYVWFLCILGVSVVVSRLVWTIDMILLAKTNIKKYYDPSEIDENKDSGEDHENEESIDDYYSTDSHGTMNPKTLLFYFSVQIIIVALIYSSTWVFCVSRAVRYRNAIDSSISRPVDANASV